MVLYRMFYGKNSKIVHIWKAEISKTISITNKFSDWLSEEEREKASRFYHSRDREAYRVSHILLRAILASYMGCHPTEINYEQGPYGKPRLYGQKRGKGICFNASKSHDITCVAVANNIEIGVDVERIRPIQDLKNIITENLSIDEQKYLFSLPSKSLAKGFFNCWTLKEAFIKAIGKGLSYPLYCFSVINQEKGIPTGGRVVTNENIKTQWFQLPLHYHPDYCSAIVIRDYYPCHKIYDLSEEFDRIITKFPSSI